MTDYNKIQEYIQREILPKYPFLDSFQIHMLPESLDKNVEFIFKSNKYLSEKQFWRLWADVDFDIHVLYEDLNFDFDFITIIL